MSDTTKALDTMQAALAGEHATIFGYGQAAGVLRGTQLAQAQRLLDRHRSRRDRLRSLIIDKGATPVASLAAYDVPPTRTAAAAASALGAMETALTALYAAMVEATDTADQAFAVTAMSETAVDTAHWKTPVPPFPGLPERAPTSSPTATSS